MSDRCKGGCGLDFDEFPEMRHNQDDCVGPDCTCYELIGGHQQGCYFYRRQADLCVVYGCRRERTDFTGIQEIFVTSITRPTNEGYRPMSDEELKQLLPITARTFLHAVEKVYETARPRKHEAPDPNKPICIHCGLADIAGDWDIYPCNDEWRKVIATQP